MCRLAPPDSAVERCFEVWGDHDAVDRFANVSEILSFSGPACFVGGDASIGSQQIEKKVAEKATVRLSSLLFH